MLGFTSDIRHAFEFADRVTDDEVRVALHRVEALSLRQIDPACWFHDLLVTNRTVEVTGPRYEGHTIRRGNAMSVVLPLCLL